MSAVWFFYGFGNAFTERGARLANISPWARGFGKLNVLNMSFVMLPAARYSIWFLIFGIPFDRTLKFHKWIGYFNFLIVTIHGLLMIIDYRAAAFQWIVSSPYWNLVCFTTIFLFLLIFKTSNCMF